MAVSDSFLRRCAYAVVSLRDELNWTDILRPTREHAQVLFFPEACEEGFMLSVLASETMVFLCALAKADPPLQVTGIA